MLLWWCFRFAGHGMVDEDDPDEGAYFCTHETKADDLLGTAFALEDVKKYMTKIGIKHQVRNDSHGRSRMFARYQFVSSDVPSPFSVPCRSSSWTAATRAAFS